jgi:hypothetical protein
LNTYAYVKGNPLRRFDLFGLNPGDLFASADDAAIDAGNFARAFPDQGVEYGGWVYQVGKCWTYNIFKGGPTELPSDKLEKSRPDGSRDIWHTHPRGHNPRYEENFSGNYLGTRPGDRTTSRESDVGVYLNTPGGRNAYYDFAQDPPERDLPSKPPEKCKQCED